MKKFLSVLTFLLVQAACVFALPGISQYVEDQSGDFVFYQDFTFTEKTYIGFLTYGDGTYAIRYYKPKAGSSEERDITLFITVDETKTHMEMTGETIEGAYKNEDVDIINYLHDLMYEFNACRQQASINSGEVIKANANIEQLGGNISISYKASIPLFNIQSVQKADGTMLLNALITGQLDSNNDETFKTFKGLPTFSDKKHSFKLNKKAQKAKVAYDKCIITLDENWLQGAENMFFLGDNAFLSMTPGKVDEASYDKALVLLEKMFYKSSETSGIVPLKNAVKTKSGTTTKFTTLHYDAQEKEIIRTFNILGKTKNGIAMYTLGVYDSTYTSNAAYFDSIMNSISY